MEKTSTGLPENVAGMLCYSLFWATGVIFGILLKKGGYLGLKWKYQAK